MPKALTQCDCLVHCHHRYPEITVGTRRNHRKDERIIEVQASFGQAPQSHTRPHMTAPMPRHRPAPTVQEQVPTASAASHPHPPLQPHPIIPASNNSSSRQLSARTEAAIELMESELRTRSWLFHTSLATPLVFANKPADHSPYQHEIPLIVNSGIYRLKSAAQANFLFLEQENRLREMIGLAHLLPQSQRRDELEDRIWREIDRCGVEKELHWNQQRLHLDIDQVVVNNGML